MPLSLTNVLTPPVLFFLLGGVSTLVRSPLEIPQAVSRAVALYLLVAIGLKGGVELSASGLSLTAMSTLGAAVAMAALIPFVAYAVLRGCLAAADAVAVAATYGSVSAVTFITAAGYLAAQGVPASGHMVAAMALMEAPAIVVALFLARRANLLDAAAETRGARAAAIETLRNEAVFLLLGSLAIGALIGQQGWQQLRPFVEAPFQGVLCFFLLEMGLLAARSAGALRAAGRPALLFAVFAPVVQGLVGLGVAALLGLPPGDALLFTVLCGSASYIAVPAALRVALPQANPSLYLSMALGITFPLNVLVGIPSYYALISWLGL